MNCRIHRGAEEIGGSCVELEAEGCRILLDLGLPFGATAQDSVPLPQVKGLATGDDPGFLGVVITHGHPDHYGLLDAADRDVPVFMGEATARILRESAFFTSIALVRAPAAHLSHRRPLQLGPFTLTPYLSDHSAFDAYSLLVEAGGRRLFYTGDLRGHGRKARLFEELLRDPPTRVHALLLEGTHVRGTSDGSEAGPSEADVEDACVETFRSTPGLVLALFSSQNLDRLVTMYRAAIRSDRDLVVDLYTTAVARATGRSSIPQAEWDRVHVFLPRSQRSRVMREEAFHRTDLVRAHRMFPEELAARKRDLVMLFRTAMAREIEAADCLEGARAVWSMWPGYLLEPSGARLLTWLDRHGIPMVTHHSSGHASIEALQRLASALAPDRIVPIHTSAPERFEAFFPRVERRRDLETWAV